MPGRTYATGLVFVLALALGACTSNGQQQRRSQNRATAAQPGPETVAAEPIPAEGPTDPGTRFIPVGQPLGQIPVETPPIPAPPVETTP